MGRRPNGRRLFFQEETMKLFIVSVEESTIHCDDVSKERENKQFTILSGFTTRRKANQYIDSQIELARHCCEDEPGGSHDFERTVHGCSWFNTFVANDVVRSDRCQATYSITELDI